MAMAGGGSSGRWKVSGDMYTGPSGMSRRSATEVRWTEGEVGGGDVCDRDDQDTRPSPCRIGPAILQIRQT